MLTINFLPWRKARQQKQAIIFLLYLLFAITVTLFFTLIIHHNISYHLKEKGRRAMLLQNYNKNLIQEKKQYQITKKRHQSLLNKLLIMHNLKKKRENIKKLTKIMPAMMGKKIILQKLTINNELLLLEANGNNHQAINKFVLKLAQLNFLETPKLTVLSENTNNQIKFSVQAGILDK